MAESPVTIITGGNTGIGYETVKALYASSQPHTILMGSRSLDKANTALSKLKSEVSESNSTIAPIQIDIEDDASIEDAFKEVETKYGRIDSLINNAGLQLDRRLLNDHSASTIRQVWDRDYSVNVTSTQVFTTKFIPLLLKSAHPRLLFLTSGLASLIQAADGPQKIGSTTLPPIPKGWPKPPIPSAIAYRASKTALNLMMLDWKRLLESDGVKVFSIAPGFLATSLTGLEPEEVSKRGAGHPSVGGIFIKDIVEGKRDADSGKVINKDGLQPW